MQKYFLLILVSLLISGCVVTEKNKESLSNTVSQQKEEIVGCREFDGTPSTEEEEHRIKQIEKECLDSDTAYSTMGMLQCMYNSGDAWDRLINKNYCAIKKIITPKEQIKLEENQKQWLENLEIEKKQIGDEAYKEHEGGSIWKLVAVPKIISLHENRSHELKDYYLKTKKEIIKL